jgi:cell wall assembly regulator SMI1
MTHDVPWSRIDAWMAEHAAKIAAQLRPPLAVDAPARRRLAREVGASLPPGVADAYAAHDGAKPDCPALFSALRVPNTAGWVRAARWFPLDDALARRALLQGAQWRPGWLPLAHDPNENLVVVDLASGAVAAWSKGPEATPLASCFGRWMGSLADDMERGLVAWSAERRHELALLDAAPVAPRAPTADEKRRAFAQSLLAFLLERDMVVLKVPDAADRTALVAALEVALATKGRPQRAGRVAEALETHDLVDEVFVDAADLERILGQF